MLRLGDYVRVLRPASLVIDPTKYRHYVGRTFAIGGMKYTKDCVRYRVGNTVEVWDESDFEYLGSNLFGIAPEVTLGDRVRIEDAVSEETVVVDRTWINYSEYGISELDDVYVAGELDDGIIMHGVLGQNAIPVSKQYTLF